MSRQRVTAHAEFAEGLEEDWATITDAQTRKRVQNRLAQRSYRHKVRERLQELEQLKTAEQRSNGRADGPASHSATRRSEVLDCTAAVQVKTAIVSSAAQDSAASTASESDLSDNVHFSTMFGNNASIPQMSSPEVQDLPVDDLFTGLSNGSAEFGAFTNSNTAVDSAQAWTGSSDTADYGFELFGPMDPSEATIQRAEARFTELMVKIRDVGFADMESMILEYYSTQFRRESLPYWLQRRSRQQNLSKLLEQLYSHSSSWPTDEGLAFQEGIQKIAQRNLSATQTNGDTFLTLPFSLGDDTL